MFRHQRYIHHVSHSFRLLFLTNMSLLTFITKFFCTANFLSAMMKKLKKGFHAIKITQYRHLGNCHRWFSCLLPFMQDVIIHYIVLKYFFQLKVLFFWGRVSDYDNWGKQLMLNCKHFMFSNSGHYSPRVIFQISYLLY